MMIFPLQSPVFPAFVSTPTCREVLWQPSSGLSPSTFQIHLTLEFHRKLLTLELITKGWSCHRTCRKWKTTTLACIIDAINSTMEKHIITLEDPLEFLHSHKKSIVSQREICTDTENYITALRASLRQSPDVILLGEMRDYETMAVAMTAAETGHLVFSTLHTLGAANTIDRIIDVFPPSQQRQIAVQLSSVLQAVVSQQLVPDLTGGLTPAFEIMNTTPAIKNMIRDNKVHQIDGLIYSSSANGMLSMDNSLLRLYQQGVIDRQEALNHASNPEMLAKKLRN